MPLPQPLFNRVLIKSLPKKDVMKSGILVAAAGYEKTEEIHGNVVAVGPEVTVVKVGNVVSFPAYGYDTVNDGEGESYMSVRDGDLLAIIPN